jgi:RHS repeat-associated protein
MTNEWNRMTVSHLVRFEYDPFARRTRKTVVTVDETGAEQIASDRRFVWDGHTVLHELPSDGDPITWYWEPGTFTPVAREHAGHLLSVASDHLGTPTEMYDETGAPTWQMHLDVLGSPTFDLGSPDDCPWRWPGQYEDEETGLYYNRRRYYDTTSGVYGSLDPLMLFSSFSFYAYVPDPTLEIDPLGETLVQTGVTASGESRLTPSWRASRGPGAMRSHHIVPQSILGDKRFSRRLEYLGHNPADWVHRQTARVANGDHTRIHAGGRYVEEWRQWFESNQRFTLRDIRHQMRNMMRKYDIPRSSANQPRYGRCGG